MGLTEPKEGRPSPRGKHQVSALRHDFIGRAAETSNRDCAQVDFGIVLARAGRPRRTRAPRRPEKSAAMADPLPLSFLNRRAARAMARILLVEDHDLVHRYLCDAILAAGHQAACVKTKDEAE